MSHKPKSYPDSANICVENNCHLKILWMKVNTES